MSVFIDDRPRSSGTSGAADRAVRDAATVDAIRRMRRPDCPPALREQLREQVLRWHLPMAYRLARGYRDRGESLDDLQQVAALAIVKAVDRYEPDRGTSFAGYATPTVLGEVKRHFRDRVWSVHVPRQLQERCLEVTRVRAELLRRWQRSPSPREVADELGIGEADVRATEASTSAYRADSLNRPAGYGDGACDVQELLGQRDPALDAVCDRVTLQSLLAQLPERERHVLLRYFVDQRTQDQIATELHTSQMSVSRLLAQTLVLLRARLRADDHGGDPGEHPTGGPRISTYETRPGCLVVTVSAPPGGCDVARLRDSLVTIAVARRPRTLVVDLRRLGDPGPTVLRALVDTYRACGHAGAALHVVNIAPTLYETLHRAGVTRLFPCRIVRDAGPSATAPVDVRPPATEPVIAATTVAAGVGRPAATGDTTATGVPSPVQNARRPCSPHSGDVRGRRRPGGQRSATRMAATASRFRPGRPRPAVPWCPREVALALPAVRPGGGRRPPHWSAVTWNSPPGRSRPPPPGAVRVGDRARP